MMATSAASEVSWKRFQRLRLIAFSCHETALNVLNAWASRTLSGLRLHLYEYFLESPSSIHAPRPSPNIFVPFVDREVASRGFCLAIPSAPEDERALVERMGTLVDSALRDESLPLSLPLGFSSHVDPLIMVQRLRGVGPLRFGALSHKLYELWKKRKWAVGDKESRRSSLRTADRMDCVRELSKKLKNRALQDSFKLGWANIFSILYTSLLASPNTKDKLFFVCVPIASELVFYGVLAVVVEMPERYGTRPDGLEILNELTLLVEKFYLPTLILTQNSWEEEQLANNLDQSKLTSSWKKSFERKLPLQYRVYSNPGLYKVTQLTIDPLRRYAGQSSRVRDAASANHDLELSLISLWDKRLKSSRESVSNSLVFSKLMIASPGMLETVRGILKAASAISFRPRPDDPFPCLLVVGSPGSGKEKISDLVPLFTKDYWKAPSVKMNMAGLPEGTGIEKFILGQTGKKKTAVIFMDELNSLDVRSQGALLRILEKGEFTSGRPRARTRVSTVSITQWLVVGLINEEPGQLTLSEIRERTSDTFIFGQFVGALLYEHFKTRSRMRDDLYYRIRRSGEVRVLDLDQRREDIPVLLYFLLSRASKTYDVFIAYDALGELVAPNLNWKGNVRQLELVARDLISIVSRRNGEVRIVTAADIRRALVNARIPGVQIYGGQEVL